MAAKAYEPAPSGVATAGAFAVMTGDAAASTLRNKI